ncbi:unnamed protein product [Heterobilharzia americana]|nr:unnamed protein product [Heterobilharzia americana]
MLKTKVCYLNSVDVMIIWAQSADQIKFAPSNPMRVTVKLVMEISLIISVPYNMSDIAVNCWQELDIVINEPLLLI